MKYIFLDFDGVLNTGRGRSARKTQGLPLFDEFGAVFDPDAVSCLQYILESVPDAVIVVESSWKAEGLERMRRMWQSRGLPGTIRDITPNLPTEGLLGLDLFNPDILSHLEATQKAKEIEAWLSGNAGPGTNYVILDDVAEFPGRMKSHHVCIDGERGLSMDDAAAAVIMLTD